MNKLKQTRQGGNKHTRRDIHNAIRSGCLKNATQQKHTSHTNTTKDKTQDNTKKYKNEGQGGIYEETWRNHLGQNNKIRTRHAGIKRINKKEHTDINK